MVILVMVSAIIGGAISIVLLWPYGMALAIIGAPFGGSLLALAVAGLVVLLHSAKRGYTRRAATRKFLKHKDSALP
jgi:hypothetical protein